MWAANQPPATGPAEESPTALAAAAGANPAVTPTATAVRLCPFELYGAAASCSSTITRPTF